MMTKLTSAFALVLTSSGCGLLGGDLWLDDPVNQVLDVQVVCGPAVCGQEGDLHVRVKDCEDGTVLRSSVEPGFRIQGQHFVRTFEVERGTWCVDAFLDRDLDGVPGPGDAVPSPAEVAIAFPKDSWERVLFELSANL